ncbi:MAG: hypothetical protein HC933_05685 [Pleurocapsa sp. SU_196_0]|nr:hypothetical protein [Pleurocapsa sp. SU_196_0]
MYDGETPIASSGYYVFGGITRFSRIVTRDEQSRTRRGDGTHRNDLSTTRGCLERRHRAVRR